MRFFLRGAGEGIWIDASSCTSGTGVGSGEAEGAGMEAFWISAD